MRESIVGTQDTHVLNPRISRLTESLVQLRKVIWAQEPR